MQAADAEPLPPSFFRIRCPFLVHFIPRVFDLFHMSLSVLRGEREKHIKQGSCTKRCMDVARAQTLTQPCEQVQEDLGLLVRVHVDE